MVLIESPPIAAVLERKRINKYVALNIITLAVCVCVCVCFTVYAVFSRDDVFVGYNVNVSYIYTTAEKYRILVVLKLYSSKPWGSRE